jgi:hypothetical protein
MAKRLFTSAALNWTASAAGSVATTSAYMAIKGGSSSQVTDVLEILYSGKATASTVTAIEFARVSTLESVATALAAPHSDGPMNPATAALTSAVVTFVAATTQPTPSNTVTDGKLQLGMNNFGGILRWNAAPTQQWTLSGNTAPGGESILWNSLTAGGNTALGDAHIMYETY